jgi:hypothetical protein
MCTGLPAPASTATKAQSYRLIHWFIVEGLHVQGTQDTTVGKLNDEAMSDDLQKTPSQLVIPGFQVGVVSSCSLSCLSETSLKN